MKNLLLAAMILGATTQVYAQKYMTRTGKVSFYSATPIEKIEAVNNEMASALDGGTGEFVFQAPVKSFKFEKALMQEHFNENYMESDKYPKADYKGKITNMSAVNLSKDGTYNVSTSGKLTMHGVTQDVTVPGTVTVKGGSATVNSKFKVKPADYKINIPKLVEGKIAKELEITVNAVLAKK